MTKRIYHSKLKIITIILSILFLIYSYLVFNNLKADIKPSIIKYYNDKNRPAHVWLDWNKTIENNIYEIVRTPSGNRTEKYTIIYARDKDRSASVEVISFKRDWLFRPIPIEMIHTNLYRKHYGETVQLAKEKDISLINAGLKEDDPRYDKSIDTFPNPTKEEWMQKLEDQKAKLFHSIPNPSGTDALEYYSSKAYDGDPSFHALKSEGPNDLYKKYFITFNTEFIEDFSVWINDDEFICDVKKPRSEYEDPITQTKEFKEFYETHKNGLYAFNTKTKTLRLFADVRYDEKKGEHFDRYFITNAKNIVIMSNTTMYEYDRNGNFMSSQKIPEQPIMSSGLKEN